MESAAVLEQTVCEWLKCSEFSAEIIEIFKGEYILCGDYNS